MAATDEQVQQFVNQRIRVRAEQIVKLLVAMEDDRATIDDVYAACSDSPTWEDNRTDGPPHLMTPSDVLAVNAFMADTITAMRAHGSFANVRNACVRNVGQANG